VSAFTLDELMGLEALALEPLTGGAEAARRRVAGAHSIEIERPSSWLAPDWVMLTAGVRLRGSAAAQRELIAELDGAGVTALGLGLELVFKHAPRALLDEAERRAFPVFAVPLHTPFREIVTSINRALLSAEVRTYQRLSSMQLYLVDALRDPEPRGAIVGRLAELLDASVVVLSTSGSVRLAAGDAPATAIWEAIAARPPALHELEVDGRHTVVAPVLGQVAEPLEHLAVVARAGASRSGLLKPAAQAAAPLLAATARLSSTERSQTRAIGAALLDGLLAPAGNLSELAARAEDFGIDLRRPARVVLARGAEAAAFHGALESLDGGVLAGRRDGGLVALVQADPAALRAGMEALEAAAVGIGRPVGEHAAIPDSLRDARLAVQRVERAGERRVLAFEEFELGLLLLSEAPARRIEPKLREWTEPLRSQPMLWSAVQAYLAADLDVARAAQSLHLHPNSLRYRLTRVEKLLGRSLKQPATIAALHLATLAD
jgi:PucR family transcriptional regulator, purine catabolism regulatory protein